MTQLNFFKNGEISEENPKITIEITEKADNIVTNSPMKIRDFFSHFIQKSDEVLNAMNDIKGQVFFKFIIKIAINIESDGEKSDDLSEFNGNTEEKSAVLYTPLLSGKDLMKGNDFQRKSKRKQ